MKRFYVCNIEYIGGTNGVDYSRLPKRMVIELKTVTGKKWQTQIMQEVTRLTGVGVYDCLFDRI